MFIFSVQYIIKLYFYRKLLMLYFKQYDKSASLIMVILSNPYMYKRKNVLGKNERIGLRKKVTETRAYRIDNADHYYF